MEELYSANNYPSLKRFTDILKENGIKSTQKEIKEFIQNHKVNQLHKPVQKIRKKLKHITASFPNEIWQIDLLDYQKYSKQNKGFKYIFIAVDIFTRQARAEPIKAKTAENTSAILAKILQEAKPKVIYSDDGSEWKGQFKKLLQENDIIHVVNDYGDHNSLGIIDRFSRTFKTMIAKYMTGEETKKWHDILQKLIRIYNNSPHTALEGVKPSEATKGNNLVNIGTMNFEKAVHNKEVDKQSNEINVGDYVRVQRLKGTFEKGYTATYTKEIHKVLQTTAQKAELDNGETVKKTKLMRVLAEQSEAEKLEAQKEKRRKKRKG
jgi:hypothetical protein